MAYKYGIDTVYLQDGSKLTFDLKTVTIPPPTSNDKINIETWNASAVKSGKTAMLHISAQGNIVGSEVWINLGNIPKGFLPAMDIVKSYIITDDNINIDFWIESNGILRLHNFSRNISGNLIKDTITYLCN